PERCGVAGGTQTQPFPPLFHLRYGYAGRHGLWPDRAQPGGAGRRPGLGRRPGAFGGLRHRANGAAVLRSAQPVATVFREGVRVMIHDSILGTVGNTPIVRINRLAPEGVAMYAKLEFFNPMSS